MRGEWAMISARRDKILLQGMIFYGYHGVNSAEKAQGQRFVVDLELERDHRAAGASDDIADTVNYAAVYAVVRDIMEGKSHNLLEHIAETIAARALSEFDIRAVGVRVKKPEVAIKGSILSYAGVEIYRVRD